MGSTYGMGLRGQLVDEIPTQQAVEIISRFAQQGYFRRFVEVVNDEVYFFEGSVVEPCADPDLRQKILNFYNGRSRGNSLPYSDMFTLTHICDGDVLGGLTPKANEDFSRYHTKMVPFEEYNNYWIGDIFPAFWSLRRYVRDKKNEDAHYFEQAYQLLKSVTTFCKQTGCLFLVLLREPS